MNDTPRADELQDYLSSRIRHACLMPSCSSLQRKMKNNVVQKYKRMLGKYNELTQANEQLEQLKQDYKEQFNELEDKQIELEQANALLNECATYFYLTEDGHIAIHQPLAEHLCKKLKARKENDLSKCLLI